MDKVADTYEPVQRRVHRTLKAALDPNGILAPGKSGIRLDPPRRASHETQPARVTAARLTARDRCRHRGFNE
jgi:hypothetical protein